MSRALFQLSPHDFEHLCAWYKSRDTLLGYNGFVMNIQKAIELAAVCEHPHAVWLTKIFAGQLEKREPKKADATSCFLRQENDTRAMCFAALLGGSKAKMREAASLGDALAQAWMARESAGAERFGWALKSAAQRERDGFKWLSYCYGTGEGCERHVQRTIENSVIAAELGRVDAMVQCGELHLLTDPQRFVWFGRAAVCGCADSFLTGMTEAMRKFDSGTGKANVIFAIGRALKGQIDTEKKTIFGTDRFWETYSDVAIQALHFYEFQLLSYGIAVNTWTVVGLKNSVVKDIRKMIAKIIWDAREEADYKLPTK
jgi:hypothetical protein